MIRKIEISIPEPCHENWREMSPTEKGKFCSSCQKNVIDFTKSSDREILLTYNKNENLCGRFRISQLDRKMIIPKEKKSLWMIAAASIIAFLGLGNHTAKAQGKIRVEQTDKKQQSDTKINKTDIKNYSGVIYDENNSPLPGAHLNIKESQKTIDTDFDGKFLIEAKEGDILIISYLDYDQIEFKITDQTNIKITIKPHEELDTAMGYGVVSPKKK